VNHSPLDRVFQIFFYISFQYIFFKVFFSDHLLRAVFFCVTSLSLLRANRLAHWEWLGSKASGGSVNNRRSGGDADGRKGQDGDGGGGGGGGGDIGDDDS
jgi:uncharacterized membrane protein YgcG